MDTMAREFLAKGKRGIVYLERNNGKVTCVKTVNPASAAQNRLEIEAQFLKKLNRHGIGPGVISYENNELRMEFIDGKRIGEFIREGTWEKKDMKKIITKILGQLFVMDTLGINKEEMTMPYKHIIITKKKEPVMIDFEKCRHTEKPANVNQFIQYLNSKAIREALHKKGLHLSSDGEETRRILKEYKKNISEKRFITLVERICDEQNKAE
ncbi:MAG: hypothetical protein V1743_05195 [Nanoarchaeota archaeon]